MQSKSLAIDVSTAMHHLQEKITDSHQRRIHGRICREKEVNLHLHLQHLSENDDFQGEWMFVESRPIRPREHNICNCGQTRIKSSFWRTRSMEIARL